MDKKEALAVLPPENKVVIRINPGIYPLEAVYSAAYVFLDDTYILLDGDPDEEILIELKPKAKTSDFEELKNTGEKFLNELLNYSFYIGQNLKNMKIKQTLLERALMTNIQQETPDENCSEEDIKKYLEDPDGIAVPWEEKPENAGKA